MQQISLVEDDPALRDALALGLINRGYSVRTFADGESALEEVSDSITDILILDLMLPRISGIDVCRGIRTRYGTLPIIMLTARGEDSLMVEGLEAGADDYIVKPCAPRVIDARIQAVLRRGGVDKATTRNRVEEFAGLTVDHDGFVVRRGATELPLTATEMRLFLTLVEHRGAVLSRQQLLERVWGYDHLGDSRVVDATMQRLRSKVERDPRNPELLTTVRGFGYRCDIA
ncbi:response regulator transcription factor [Gordonia sp. HY285]|uniref:response regulator transcription factor n=1 Tax=Gordonia liuliyuniae TaxID=2911517 RepID=UPI001F1E9E92|nr:response regulator transcription factor [Gordonia liuliyuniae]MCF8608911.1 response regulator transcription factor [Gordonia liuliyuniae]